MSVTINGSGSISGVSAGGISSNQIGKVLQVVTGTYSTETSSSSSTLANTGLSATITPTASSSKILVLLSQNGLGKDTNSTYERVALLRDTTVIAYAVYQAGQTNTTAVNYGASASLAYLDSPATTSAITYKTQFSSGANNAIVYVQIGGSNTVSTITLLEIAA